MSGLIFVIIIKLSFYVMATKLDSTTDLIQNKLQNNDNCICGIFDTKTPTETQIPIISPSYNVVNCNRLSTCYRFCLRMLLKMKDDLWDLLCYVREEDYQRLKAHVHVRVCGGKRWLFTGIALTKNVCCKSNRLIKC